MPRLQSELPKPQKSARAEVEVSDTGLLLSLTGPGGTHLRTLEKAFGIGIGMRGNVIRLSGPRQDVRMAERTLAELLEVVRRGRHLGEREVQRSIDTLRRHPDVKLHEMMSDSVVVDSGRRSIAPKGVAQQQYIHAIREHDVVFGVGPAGTGKTYLAMASAVSALMERQYKRIILTRPAVEAGEKLGFLPGDLAEKVNPYLRPLYDALQDMLDPARCQRFVEQGTIEVAPLAFMRGRTLNKCFVIMDEAQNSTREQMKMFLTRLGADSQAVITGDVTQIDLERNHHSGLLDARRVLCGIDSIPFIQFERDDVVRHPLVRRILHAYERAEAHETSEHGPR